MVRLRLSRVGRKNDPCFRIVAQDHRLDPQARYLEVLGHYNPRQKTKSFHKERILHWLKQGAQPTATVHNLLVSEGIIKASKIKVARLKPKKKKEEVSKKLEKKEVASSEDKPLDKEQEDKSQAAGDKGQVE